METRSRILSLDVFRGATIVAMILVNNPGSWDYVYSPLLHAEWHGCTPTDLIFPFFLFIVGVAITISLKKRKERGDEQGKIIINIFRRSIILFFLGLFLTGFPSYDISTIRIMGVLQRIAIVYLISSIIYLKFSTKFQFYFAVGLLVTYWIAMSFIPVPDRGITGLSIENNLAAWIDRNLLGSHLWYYTETWDPEGLFSTIPAIATSFIGVFAGNLLLSQKSTIEKNLLLFISAIMLLIISYFWNFAFPINKNLWTSSYVLFSGGIALSIYGFCYWIVDIKGYYKYFKYFNYFGMNAITVYFLSELITKIFYEILVTTNNTEVTSLKEYLYDAAFIHAINPYLGSFLYAFLYIIVMFVFVRFLYKKNIFIKV